MAEAGEQGMARQGNADQATAAQTQAGVGSWPASGLVQ